MNYWLKVAENKYETHVSHGMLIVITPYDNVFKFNAVVSPLTGIKHLMVGKPTTFYFSDEEVEATKVASDILMK